MECVMKDLDALLSGLKAKMALLDDAEPKKRLEDLPDDLLKHIGSFINVKQLALQERITKIMNKIDDLKKPENKEHIYHIAKSYPYKCGFECFKETSKTYTYLTHSDAITKYMHTKVKTTVIKKNAPDSKKTILNVVYDEYCDKMKNRLRILLRKEVEERFNYITIPKPESFKSYGYNNSDDDETERKYYTNDTDFKNGMSKVTDLCGNEWQVKIVFCFRNKIVKRLIWISATTMFTD